MPALRSRLFAFLVAFTTLVLAACGPTTLAPTAPPNATSTTGPAITATPAPTEAPAATFPLTITDDDGTAVAIPAEPQHIVSLTPAATETLFAIGAGDRVVAKVQDITPYPPEADALPVVATYNGVDVEQIVGLKGDLVIAGGNNFTKADAITQLRGLGIPVIVLYARTVDDALSGMQRIGDAVGESAAAHDLVAAMSTEMAEIGQATSALDHPKTFYEIDGTSDLFTIPEHSLYAELLQLAGADPITTDDSYAISLEEVVAANPTVILLGDGGYTTAADVTARPGWSGIAAVKSGTILPVDDTLITRPGPRLVEGLRSLVEALHPEVLR
jgi:iron complex transport system substrate-binding protein